MRFSKEDELLGTGGAILNGIKIVQGKKVIVQNADTFIPLKLEELLDYNKRISR